ncbi:YcxB family protein [Colwellia ponticola]|uniref:YcxB family protein n=1 Tax=Colwellia ponticola TaxID=2304625 RepID=A0A8H2JMR0_9GAMM|nr:YcxB family protein [Colwellia ponticola]TMM46066.1 YcxB family protein [Colwellia ponticola]
MTQSSSYTANFTLDKAHYTECYTQSSTLEHNKKTYFKANILTVFGLIILFATPVNPYAAWFVIALGILETLSVYYHKPWWVTRQMLSKASNSKVTLTIDEQGILTESFHVNSRILWADVTSVVETDLGFVINFSLGKSVTGKDIASKSYISKACLSDEAISFIKAKNPVMV